MLNGAVGDAEQCAVFADFGIDGPVCLNSRWLALAANIGAYIWKNLPFWTVILLAGRMAIPQELYEAAEVDGATGLRRLTHVTLPLMANLYIVCTLLSTVFALGDFNSVYFVSGGGPGDVDARCSPRSASAMPSVRAARLGVAAVMTALPVLIPLVLRPDAQAAHVGGAAVSRRSPTRPACRRGATARRRRWREAGLA